MTNVVIEIHVHSSIEIPCLVSIRTDSLAISKTFSIGVVRGDRFEICRSAGLVVAKDLLYANKLDGNYFLDRIEQTDTQRIYVYVWKSIDDSFQIELRRD